MPRYRWMIEIPKVPWEPLSAYEVARLAGVSARTVQRWYDRGELRGWRAPGIRRRRQFDARVVAVFFYERGWYIPPRLKPYLPKRLDYIQVHPRPALKLPGRGAIPLPTSMPASFSASSSAPRPSSSS